jgi:hypothetical protein
MMSKVCDVCGNKYDKMMKITKDEEEFYFDSFECAIHALAPRCDHCEVPIVGHGLEEEGQFFCCANCARQAGQDHFVDRISDVRL